MVKREKLLTTYEADICADVAPWANALQNSSAGTLEPDRLGSSPLSSPPAPQLCDYRQITLLMPRLPLVKGKAVSAGPAYAIVIITN